MWTSMSYPTSPSVILQESCRQWSVRSVVEQVKLMRHPRAASPARRENASNHPWTPLFPKPSLRWSRIWPIVRSTPRTLTTRRPPHPAIRAVLAQLLTLTRRWRSSEKSDSKTALCAAHAFHLEPDAALVGKSQLWMPTLILTRLVHP